MSELANGEQVNESRQITNCLASLLGANLGFGQSQQLLTLDLINQLFGLIYKPKLGNPAMLALCALELASDCIEINVRPPSSVETTEEKEEDVVFRSLNLLNLLIPPDNSDLKLLKSCLVGIVEFRWPVLPIVSADSYTMSMTLYNMYVAFALHICEPSLFIDRKLLVDALVKLTQLKSRSILPVTSQDQHIDNLIRIIMDSQKRVPDEIFVQITNTIVYTMYYLPEEKNPSPYTPHKLGKHKRPSLLDFIIPPPIFGSAFLTQFPPDFSQSQA